MIADGLDRMVLLLLVAGGAALALGAVGIVNPAWATDHAAFLTMAGAAVPFLSVVAVHVRQSMLDADASREHTYADAERLRAQAESSRSRQDTPAMPPQAPVGQIDVSAGKDTAKRLAIETFFLAGEKAGGFSEGKLAGCVGSDHGPWLRHFYISPAGGEWLMDAGSNQGTVWNTNREPPATIEAARRALMAGEMPLPPGPVPDVRPLPDSAAQRRAPRSSAKVVDGTSKPLTS